MVVIFAVAEYMDAIYRELSRFIQVKKKTFYFVRIYLRREIQGTENIGHLTKDPSSLEDIVVKQYEEIKSRIALKVETSDPGIGVSLSSNCASPGPNHLTCPGVGEGDVVDFTATLRLEEDSCRGRNADVVKQVKIKLSGFEDEALELEVH